MAKLKRPKRIDIGVNAEVYETDDSFAAKGEALSTKQELPHGWDEVQQLEAASKTHLEDDKGGGGAAIIRCFEFGMNPQAFGDYQPTKQELFNSHYRGIETALWRDGLKVIPEVHPRIVVDVEAGRYSIFVGAQPMKGHILAEQPRTLAEQIRG